MAREISRHAHEPRSRSPSRPDAFEPLAREALPGETVALARALLGCILVADSGDERCAVRIVETEAYPPGDAASHAFRGRTPRNGSMFAPPGRAYVYFIYGMWFCLNVSSEREGVGAAVLVRAAESLDGLPLLRTRGRPDAADSDLCRGPGRLARALGLSRLYDGIDLFAPGPLRLARSTPVAAIAVGTSTRIGLRVETERPWRFYVRGSAALSGPRRLSP